MPWPALDLVRRPAAVVAVDIDEVLVRYVEAFRRFVARESHGGGLDIAAAFREAHDPQSAWRSAFARSGGLDRLDEVPGAVAAIGRLRAAGVRLEAVTTRPSSMRASTEEMFRRCFPANTFAAIHFVRPGEKGATCSRLGAQALIDDQLANVADAAKFGVPALLFDLAGAYTWTRTGGDLPPGVTRVQSWTAAVERIFEMLGYSENDAKRPCETYKQASCAGA